MDDTINILDEITIKINTRIDYLKGRISDTKTEIEFLNQLIDLIDKHNEN